MGDPYIDWVFPHISEAQQDVWRRLVNDPHGRDLLKATLVHLLAHTHTLRLSLVPSPRSFSTDFFPFAWKRRLLGQWLLGSSISTPKVPRFHLVLNYFPPPGNSHLFPPSPALLDQVLYLERLATF